MWGDEQEGGDYLGASGSQIGAARILAAHLKVSVRSLAIRRVPRLLVAPRPTHKFVYWHALRGKWVVIIEKKHHGVFDEQGLAVLAAGRILKLKPRAFELQGGSRPGLMGQRGSSENLARLFKRVFPAYCGRGRTERQRLPVMPGDVADMHSRLKAPIMQDPSMVYYMCLAKYGPHRDALEEAYSRHQGQVQDCASLGTCIV